MDLEFAPTIPAWLDQVRELFKSAFPLNPQAKPLESRLVAWKYFDPHPFWPGPRSYVVRRDKEIAAHIGLAPVRFATPRSPVDSGQFLDWMANPRIAGGGVFAYWECLGVVDAVLVVGGSEDAQRILPKMKWLRRIPELRLYARPLHVLGTIGGMRWRRAKTPFKLARNLLWSVTPPLPSAGEWRALPLPSLTTVWTPHGDFIPIERTADWLNFHLKCPAVRFEAISLERNGRPAGHALLAYAGPQVRIADFVIDTMDEEQWTQACSALIRAVMAEPGAYEVAAGSSLPFLQRVFERCGLRYRGSMLAYVGDPNKRFSPNDLLELSLLTGDSSYLVNEQDPLWC
jgi:hypothetical protein